MTQSIIETAMKVALAMTDNGTHCSGTWCHACSNDGVCSKPEYIPASQCACNSSAMAVSEGEDTHMPPNVGASNAAGEVLRTLGQKFSGPKSTC